MKNLLLLLLPFAAATGWFAAKRSEPSSPLENKQFAREYLIGLNYLLNEQPDKAVDVFIKILEVDSETVETHLALGTLFRRRGEVGRAIRIHQNLIARPQLPKQQRTEALLALGQDYLRAGLLDRAERLFAETAEIEGAHQSIALHYLLDIYQQQKRWDAAIATAKKLPGKANITTHNLHIAHYYCELAQQAHEQGQMESAFNHLKQALIIDPRCIRANLLRGEFESKAKRFQAAAQAYQQVYTQDADFFSEAIPPLIHCYQQLNDEAGLYQYLQTCLQQQPRISLVLALVDRIQQQQGTEAAAQYIAQQLRQRPSLRGLQRLITIHLENAAHQVKENLLILQDLTHNLLKNKPIYRCLQCGFSGKVLHWLCPSCKNWSSIKPIQGLEGE